MLLIVKYQINSTDRIILLQLKGLIESTQCRVDLCEWTRNSTVLNRYSTFSNSKLDFSNSKLDFSNSKLDFSNSKLDVSNSKLDFFNLKLDFSNSKLDVSNSKLDFSDSKFDVSNSKFDAQKKPLQIDYLVIDMTNEPPDTVSGPNNFLTTLKRSGSPLNWTDSVRLARTPSNLLKSAELADI